MRERIQNLPEWQFQLLCICVLIVGLLCLQFVFRSQALRDIELVDAPVGADMPPAPEPEPAAEPPEEPEASEEEQE